MGMFSIEVNMLIEVRTSIKVYILLDRIYVPQIDCILNFELLFGQQKYGTIANGSNIFFAKEILKCV